MRNPVKAIREARRQADSVLSSHEISFALLVSNIADDGEFEKQLGFGLVAADSLAFWERSRFRRKLRKLHAKALERVEIRRFVAEPGREALAKMRDLHFLTGDERDRGVYLSRSANPSGKYISLDPEPTLYLTPFSDEQWPDEIEID
jgi:hypothetical protein